MAPAEVKLGNEVLVRKTNFKVLQRQAAWTDYQSFGSESECRVHRRGAPCAPGVKLAALFGPEHGVYGDIEAGKRWIRWWISARDYRRIRSTTKNAQTDAKNVEDLDALVCRLQDTGAAALRRLHRHHGHGDGGPVWGELGSSCWIAPTRWAASASRARCWRKIRSGDQQIRGRCPTFMG